MWALFSKWMSLGAARDRWVEVSPDVPAPIVELAYRASASLAANQALAIALSALVAELLFLVGSAQLGVFRLPDWRAAELIPALVAGAFLHLVLLFAFAVLERRRPSTSLRSTTAATDAFLKTLLTATSMIRLPVTPDVRERELGQLLQGNNGSDTAAAIAEALEDASPSQRGAWQEVGRVFGTEADDLLALALLTNLAGIACASLSTVGFISGGLGFSL